MADSPLLFQTAHLVAHRQIVNVLTSNISLVDIYGFSGVMQARSSLQDVLNCLSFLTIVFAVLLIY